MHMYVYMCAYAVCMGHIYMYMYVHCIYRSSQSSFCKKEDKDDKRNSPREGGDHGSKKSPSPSPLGKRSLRPRSPRGRRRNLPTLVYVYAYVCVEVCICCTYICMYYVYSSSGPLFTRRRTRGAPPEKGVAVEVIGTAVHRPSLIHVHGSFD